MKNFLSNELYLVISIVILSTIIIYSLHKYVYVPYFTDIGIFTREVNYERRLEEKVLYYTCGLPEDNKYYLKFKEECKLLKERAEYDDSQQNCSPNYMGGCD